MDNKIGVIFNHTRDLYIPLLQDLELKGNYFSIIDDFYCPECSDIIKLPFDSTLNKISFMKNFSCLDDILSICFDDKKIKHIELFISPNQSCNKSEFIEITVCKENFLESFYNSIFDNKNKIIGIPTIHFKIFQ